MDIRKLLTADGFERVASHSNNLTGHSFVNRVAIYEQNAECTDVRSRLAWKIAGRLVMDNAKGIELTNTVNKVTYREVGTGRLVPASELRPDEFTMALELGLIIKHIDVAELRSAFGYDIKDTYEIEGFEPPKEVWTRKLKLSAVFKLLESIGISVAKDDIPKTAFDNEDSTLIIGNDSLDERLEECLSTVVEVCIKHGGLDGRLSRAEVKLIRDYVVYAAATYFKRETNIKFDYVDKIYKSIEGTDRADILIGVLEVLEDMLNKYIFNECMENFGDDGYTDRESIAHKASLLLSIMDANELKTRQ